jgi:hypothetical protein
LESGLRSSARPGVGLPTSARHHLVNEADPQTSASLLPPTAPEL